MLIVDIPNPLIGDINEYERFVNVNTQQEAKEPIDHGESPK